MIKTYICENQAVGANSPLPSFSLMLKSVHKHQNGNNKKYKFANDEHGCCKILKKNCFFDKMYGKKPVPSIVLTSSLCELFLYSS